ncbi:hypothetical protein OAG44_01260 [bacterium]|nr:hypothetical protein [bacterium]
MPGNEGAFASPRASLANIACKASAPNPVPDRCNISRRESGNPAR